MQIEKQTRHVCASLHPRCTLGPSHPCSQCRCQGVLDRHMKQDRCIWYHRLHIGHTCRHNPLWPSQDCWLHRNPAAKYGNCWIWHDQTHGPWSIQFPTFSTTGVCAEANPFVSWLHWSQGEKNAWETKGVEEVATSVELAIQSNGSKEEKEPRKKKKPSSYERSGRVWPKEAHTHPIHWFDPRDSGQTLPNASVLVDR